MAVFGLVGRAEADGEIGEGEMNGKGRLSSIGCAAVVLATGLLVWLPGGRAGEAFVARQCTDNSTIERNWTHGDPNEEDFGEPSNPGIPPHNGYYYLDIKACDTTIYGVVYTAGDWAVQFQDASGTHLQAAEFHGTTALLVMDNATVGSVYRFRVANIGTSYVHDYAEFNSGQPGPDDQVSTTSKASPEEEESGEPDTVSGSSSTSTSSSSRSTSSRTTPAPCLLPLGLLCG